MANMMVASDYEWIFKSSGNQCGLQSIGLGGNDIHDEGAIHLAKALLANTQLRSLGLGGNQIGVCVCMYVYMCVDGSSILKGMKVEKRLQIC